MFGSNWTKATEGHPGKTVVGPGHWRFLLGLTASSLLGKGEGAPYIAKTYLSSYRQNDVMSRICFKITCKVRLKVKRDKMKGT